MTYLVDENANPINDSNQLPTRTFPGMPLVYTNTTGASAVNQDAIPQQDLSQVSDITVQLTGTWAGTVTFQGSNDGINWQSVIGYGLSNPNSAPGTTATANALFLFSTGFRYFRARVTSYTSGAVTATLVGNRQSTPMPAVGGTFGIASGNSIAVQGRNTAGATISRRVSTADTNAANIKSTAATLYNIFGFNTAASARYLKMYNKSTAPTVGTDTPLFTMQLPIGPFNYQIAADIGGAFSAGIGIGITGAPADSDTTAIVAGEVHLNLAYF